MNLVFLFYIFCLSSVSNFGRKTMKKHWIMWKWGRFGVFFNKKKGGSYMSFTENDYFCKGFHIRMQVQRQNSNNNRNQDQWQLIQLH